MDHVVVDVHAGLIGFIGEEEGVAVELRVGRHPAAAHGFCHGIGDHLVPNGTVASKRRSQVGGARIIVAVLLGGEVVEAGGNHVARRALPVGGHGPLGPAVDRAQLFLAHVVRPTATVNALGAAHGGQRQEGAVDIIGVEVVVDASAHDDL